MSGQVASFVGSIPENYDRGLGPMIFVDYALDMAKRAAASKPARVLETACGTGIVTRKLRDLLPAAAQLTATDLNPPMVEVARGKFRAGEKVELKQADATQLPFADASFDAVICQFGVMFFPDKDKSYREVQRVLAPGGRYLFNVWDAHRYNAYARIAHETIGSFFPADPPGFYRVPFGYHAIDPIKESLLAAGFTGLSASVVTVEKEIPEAAQFARGLVFGNPVIEQINQRGGVEAEQVRKAVTDALIAAFGRDPGRMTLQAIVFEAMKR
ncbi:MAG: methyltransferase domain-containing protein [Proteobacteria bacterium]|nr:methyltransferase domain-containing protein [Pseudomonadota bacterium]MBI3499225.1 methyltransferase domain-containing protein [Pseudomonadota bacterium]